MNVCVYIYLVMCLMVNFSIYSWKKKLFCLESLDPEHTWGIFWNCSDKFGLFFYFTYLDLQNVCVVQQVSSLCPYSSLSSNLINIIVIHFSSFQWNFIPPKFQGPDKVPKCSRTHHVLATQFLMYLREGRGWNRPYSMSRKSVHLVVVYGERRGKLER